MKSFVLNTIGFVALSSACGEHTTRPAMRMYESEPEMRSEILRLLPIGTSVKTAKTTMEKAGFVCNLEKDKLFLRHDGATVKASHFLYCDKRSEDMPVVRRWQVVMETKDEMVSTVDVSIGLIGL